MKHGMHLSRGLFLAAALGLAGQARALGTSSGGASAGTGGPQGVYELHRAEAGAASTIDRGATGVPAWYAVDATVRRPRAPQPTMLVDRGGSVPRWYAID